MLITTMFELRELFQNNIEKLNWDCLSCNRNAIRLLKKNPDKIHWNNISLNPSIFEETYYLK
jgi:hypothetical protein